MQINKNQLIVLIILFEIGSTTLYALGVGTVKQDAWLAIMIASLIGGGLLWMYTSIQKYYYQQDLGGILTIVLGRWISKPIILLYALYFIYIASLNLYTFSITTEITILPGTPLLAIQTLIVLVLIYIVAFLNIEVLARTGEILAPLFLLFLIIIYTLVIFSGVFHGNNLLPMMENGIPNIISTSIFKILNFPFAETIVFLMYWKYVDCKQSIRKFSFIAYVISSLFIIISIIVVIGVLGVTVASITTLPLFNVLQKIDLGNFVIRLDPLGVSILFIGGFFKMVLNFYAGLLLLQSLFKIACSKWMTIIVCIVFLCGTSLQFPSITIQRWIGLSIMIPYVHTIFQVGIPCLIFILIKVKFKTKNNSL
ncbi:GerAB/ArcD/ProY family transporter [Bacillus mycoides]|uniref:GerAB/ArcD/ProY family transporter n=1 Tax=Bacillus mycoides TaxID=1405 RepID=UPI000BFE2513|nr:GerAB/ArcD/ProY family transporter [Bacillus mycoides]MCQ6530456.1 spore germination protein [Bacillus mycoides]PGT51229.1 spore gernimation protein [Bacillus cereus]